MGLIIKQVPIEIGTYTYINTPGSSQSILSGVQTRLENDGIAGQNYPINGLPEIFDTTTFLVKTLAPALSFGDIVEVGLSFQATTTSPNQSIEILSIVALGSPTQTTVEVFNQTFKSAGLQSFSSFFLGDGQTADQLNFPSAFEVLSDDALTISMASMFFKITKRNLG